MADPKKSSKKQSDEKKAPAPVVKPLSLAAQAKARRIAEQKERELQNRIRKANGERTPFEEKKVQRMMARKNDPVIRQRQARIEAERREILLKQERAAKDEELRRAVRQAQHASSSIQQVHGD